MDYMSTTSSGTEKRHFCRIPFIHQANITYNNDTWECISCGWGMTQTINGHFSPDGSKLVFMSNHTGQWDIYLWAVGSSEIPENLTESLLTVDEDPKFFLNDNNHIVFKQNGDIKKMRLSDKHIDSVTDKIGYEEGMPYTTVNGDSVLYGMSDDIYIISTENTGDRPLEATPGIEEYYPITRNDWSFLYARDLPSTTGINNIYLINIVILTLNSAVPETVRFT